MRSTQFLFTYNCIRVRVTSTMLQRDASNVHCLTIIRFARHFYFHKVDRLGEVNTIFIYLYLYKGQSHIDNASTRWFKRTLLNHHPLCQVSLLSQSGSVRWGQTNFYLLIIYKRRVHIDNASTRCFKCTLLNHHLLWQKFLPSQSQVVRLGQHNLYLLIIV